MQSSDFFQLYMSDRIILQWLPCETYCNQSCGVRTLYRARVAHHSSFVQAVGLSAKSTQELKYCCFNVQSALNILLLT